MEVTLDTTQTYITITEDHVGKIYLEAFGDKWFLGKDGIQKSDVGKRLYKVGENISMESDKEWADREGYPFLAALCLAQKFSVCEEDGKYTLIKLVSPRFNSLNELEDFCKQHGAEVSMAVN